MTISTVSKKVIDAQILGFINGLITFDHAIIAYCDINFASVSLTNEESYETFFTMLSDTNFKIDVQDKHTEVTGKVFFEDCPTFGKTIYVDKRHVFSCGFKLSDIKNIIIVYNPARYETINVTVNLK